MKFNEFKVGMVLHDKNYNQHGIIVEKTPTNIKMFVLGSSMISNIREISVDVNISIELWDEKNSWASARLIKHPKMTMRRFVREIFEGNIV